MAHLICPRLCPQPFCVSVCVTDALYLADNDENVYADPERCYQCGLCRAMCIEFSDDKMLQRRRPWVAAEWLRTRGA